MAEAACRRCAWREEPPIDVDELLRLHDLLSLGLTLPVGRRTRWEEDALLIIDHEHAEQRAARQRRPP